MKLDDKTILITGASQGIGRYLCTHFGTRCAKVIGVARNVDNLNETAAQAKAAGANISCYPMDLSDSASIQNFVDALEGGVDILIHNAADVTSKPLHETSIEEIDSLVRTNITGALQLTRLLLPSMKKSGSPAIVTVSSLAGFKPNPTQTVYSITKHAVNGMAKALRAELAPEGFHVLNVALSSVATQGNTSPGQVSLERCATLIEGALCNEQDELFLSPASKWLMRLYAAVPVLMKPKRVPINQANPHA